jgi:tungstate transport system ATP-binding protein
MAEALLALCDVRVQHGSSTVLRLHFAVHVGEVVVVIGPNGAGKSTLLRVMGLLQRPSSGSVYFHGEQATAKNSLAMRRHMASVFQEPLLLDGTVYDNAALGLKLRGFRRDEIEKKLRPWLKRLGIDHLTERRARTLSGGEAQRTSLVRGLVLDPSLLLLDEPFAALDAPTRETLLLDLREILAETGITAVMVTHDLKEAAALGQRIGVLHRGELLQLGPQLEVFRRPVNEAAASIVGMETRIAAVAERTQDQITTMRFNGGSVNVRGEFPAGAQVTLCIRPEDIRISRHGDGKSCAKSDIHIKTKIARIAPSIAEYRISLRADCGCLTALVSKPSFDGLSLREGDEALASFSPDAIHGI